MIVGDENVSTPHYQGYVYFHNATTMSALKKKLPRAHLEPAISSPQKNRVYCSKQKIYIEHGTIPQQGQRTDLVSVCEEIKNGTTTVGDIMEEDPMFYHQYGRTLRDLEDHVANKKERDWMTEGVWIVGPSGSGKSHLANEGYHRDTHYTWNLRDKDWQDKYMGQETVIIDDFRGTIPYEELLKMIDKYRYDVSRRGRAPRPFLAKKIIITSVLRPEQVYHNRHAKDSIEQLMRRLKVIELKSQPI